MTREETILSLGGRVKLLASMRMRTIPPGRVSFEDMVSSGWVGAIQAVDRFDPSLGFSLVTIADRRIRGAMSDYLRTLDPLTRDQRAKVRRGEERTVRMVGMSEMVREPEDGRADARPGQGLDRLDLDLLFMRSGLAPRARRVFERVAGGELERVIAADEGVSQALISRICLHAVRKMAACAGVSV